MLNATRRRLGSSALLAAGLVILLPALAEAQLFPNRTIRREKPSCATEPPFYKQVRRDYFGYYPTCWSRFPAGWGCPCPDLELQQLRSKLESDPPKINSNPNNGDAGFGAADPDEMDTGDAPKPNPNDPNIPALPPGASPFEMDSGKPITPPAGPGAAPGRPAGPGAPGPGANLSPSMELPSLPSTSPTTSNEPTSRPGSMALYPEEATLTSNTTTARPDLGPLPSAPTPDPNTPETAAGVVSGMAPTINGSPAVLGNPAPAQAPKRRSLLGQLFGRSNSTTVKR